MSSDPVKEYESTKTHAWYVPNIDSKVTPEVRRLLENYSNIPSQDVLKHVHDIRDKAWAIRPYPCTGLGSFLDPMIAKSPAYPMILSRLKNGDSFIDVGCYVGHDLRRLVFDGAPMEHLYGVDIVNHWDLGYEMFQDANKFKAKFIEADILHPNAALQALAGKLDIISITHVLHQWKWDEQIAAAKQLAILSKPGSIIVGFQVGSTDPQQVNTGKYERFRHSSETFKHMWDVVGRELGGMEWKCDAVLKTWDELDFDPGETVYLGEDARVLQFVISRVP